MLATAPFTLAGWVKVVSMKVRLPRPDRPSAAGDGRAHSPKIARHPSPNREYPLKLDWMKTGSPRVMGGLYEDYSLDGEPRLIQGRPLTQKTGGTLERWIIG